MIEETGRKDRSKKEILSALHDNIIMFDAQTTKHNLCESMLLFKVAIYTCYLCANSCFEMFPVISYFQCGCLLHHIVLYSSEKMNSLFYNTHFFKY